MFHSAQYEARAAAIHNRPIDSGLRRDPNNGELSKDAFWLAHVRTKEDVERFYLHYYPAFTKEMCAAMGDYYTRAISGEINLPDTMLRHSETNKARIAARVWDPLEDLAKERLAGKIANSIKRMDELLSADNDDRKEEKKTS